MYPEFDESFNIHDETSSQQVHAQVAPSYCADSDYQYYNNNHTSLRTKLAPPFVSNGAERRRPLARIPSVRQHVKSYIFLQKRRRLLECPIRLVNAAHSGPNGLAVTSSCAAVVPSTGHSNTPQTSGHTHTAQVAPRGLAVESYCGSNSFNVHLVQSYGQGGNVEGVLQSAAIADSGKTVFVETESIDTAFEAVSGFVAAAEAGTEKAVDIESVSIDIDPESVNTVTEQNSDPGAVNTVSDGDCNTVVVEEDQRQLLFMYEALHCFTECDSTECVHFDMSEPEQEPHGAEVERDVVDPWFGGVEMFRKPSSARLKNKSFSN